jgi:hypothetical protein
MVEFSVRSPGIPFAARSAFTALMICDELKSAALAGAASSAEAHARAMSRRAEEEG